MSTSSSSVNFQPFVLDPRATASLRMQTRGDPQANLKQVAQQFEGIMLQMMLKSMREASPQDGLFDSDQTRFFTTVLDQQLAQDMSSKGTMGFAKLIEKQFAHAQPSVSNGAAPTADSPAKVLDALRQASLSAQAAKLAALSEDAENSPSGQLPSFLSGAALRAARSNVMGSVTSGTNAAKSISGADNLPVAPQGSNDFVNRIWPHASEAARSLGVPTHFVVAQSALESAWGKSEIRAADGSPSYNLFGVKAGRNWNGATVDASTTEYVDGVAQTSKERFRAYSSYAEAFRDYAQVLRSNGRFAGVLGQQDGEQFAKSMQQSGYATDPAYAEKLTKVINGPTLRQAMTG